MKKVRFALALVGLFVSSAVHADLFDNIQLWTGTGQNEAALEIDWNNGTANDALIWGYRWNGTATGEQMLYAIMAADPRLFAEVSGNTQYGTALFGIGYHPAGDGNFSLSPALSFDSQHLAFTDYSGVNDSRTATGTGDFWGEGWYGGYWSYWVSTDSRLSADYTDWGYSGLGMSSRELSNGDVDGWSFAPGFDSTTPSVPLAASVVPEPGTWAMLATGGLFFFWLQRRRERYLPIAILSLSLFANSKVSAISLDDIQLWTGSGTNRAALVIEWSVPESLTNSTVPVPVADKTLVWGYRFNGTATATEMLDAVVATDPKLYVVKNDSFGTFVEGIGYNLNANGNIGITDGTNTNHITNGILVTATVDIDSAQAVNNGDLYWGGLYGPNWEVWTETNGTGGLFSSPNRGTNAYWTPTDTTYYSAGDHGQWELAQSGLDDLPLTNGSWIGFSVAAGEYEPAANAAYNAHKHAPVSPDGTYVAYVCNTNDFAVQIVSSANIYTHSPYSNVLAVLGPPTLKFYDIYDSRLTNEITKVVEPEYWTLPDKVTPDICEISVGGYITLKMGAPIYHNPNNPYGLDFIVFGNSFYVDQGGSTVNNLTDMDSLPIAGLSGTYGHTTTVSVSQDGVNWYTYPYVPFLLPSDAYQWDRANHAWKNEKTFESKPVNPTLNFPGGIMASDVVDQYVGANGGTGYSLQPSGLPWIQYVRIWAGTSTTDTSSGDYTVIDAIGAVHPATVGDALSITPSNLVSGVTSLAFQNPANPGQTLISLNFDSVSTNTRISTVSLHQFSAFAPVVGNVLSAYQIQSRPLAGATDTALQADIGLAVGQNYSGNGSDLRVYQWNCTNWTSQPFIFNPANDQVFVTDVTNFSAFVVSQIVPPNLSAQSFTNGFTFQFTPVANCPHVLERSTDLVNWISICTNTLPSAQPVTWQDTNAPQAKAFYRILLNVP
jgi:hypothetical protein